MTIRKPKSAANGRLSGGRPYKPDAEKRRSKYGLVTVRINPDTEMVITASIEDRALAQRLMLRDWPGVTKVEQLFSYALRKLAERKDKTMAFYVLPTTSPEEIVKILNEAYQAQKQANPRTHLGPQAIGIGFTLIKDKDGNRLYRNIYRTVLRTIDDIGYELVSDDPAWRQAMADADARRKQR